MNRLACIRRTVFKTSQSAFADLAGVTQGTVSRWERCELEPSHSQLEKIRSEALRRGIAWSDEFFFSESVLTTETNVR